MNRGKEIDLAEEGQTGTETAEAREKYKKKGMTESS
jgi:hypothetical protein